jgi:hypothetical protein
MFPSGALVRVSASPRVYVMDGFVSEDEIEAVKSVGDAVQELEAIGLEVIRGNAGRACDLPALDDTLQAIGRRIESLVGCSDMLDDSLRFRRYGVGEFHRRHTDAVLPVDGLHLIVTALVCLDAPEEGGETVFPYAQGGSLAISHRRGRLVLWFNYLPDGTVDHAAIHEGARVLRGTKATIGKFLHRPLGERGDLAAAHAVADAGAIADELAFARLHGAVAAAADLLD